MPVLTGTSKMTLSVPRDRAGTFDPKLIAKYQRRFPDFDDKIISMYARGMTVREVRGHLEELYGMDVSPDLISPVTRVDMTFVIHRDAMHDGPNRRYEGHRGHAVIEPSWSIVTQHRVTFLDLISPHRQGRLV